MGGSEGKDLYREIGQGRFDIFKPTEVFLETVIWILRLSIVLGLNPVATDNI